MPWRRGDINGRNHRHAASHSRHVLSLHDEAHLEPVNPQFVLSRRVAFVKQPRPNRPAISLPCSSFQIGANRWLRIAAPLYFGSGSVRSIHEKSWSALLASAFVASRSSARVSKGRCFSELVPLRSPDSDSSSYERRSFAAGEMFEPARDLASACFLSICQSQEQSLNFGSQSLILRH